MALEDFFDHTCDIYHINKESSSPGFGLPASADFSYSEQPDIAGQICHFAVKSRTMNVIQLQPQSNLEDRIKLTLPLLCDIRLNDKVVNCQTGLIYTAELPINVRNHHKFVWIKRKEEGKPL